MHVENMAPKMRVNLLMSVEQCITHHVVPTMVQTSPAWRMPSCSWRKGRWRAFQGIVLRRPVNEFYFCPFVMILCGLSDALHWFSRRLMPCSREWSASKIMYRLTPNAHHLIRILIRVISYNYNSALPSYLFFVSTYIMNMRAGVLSFLCQVMFVHCCAPT